VEVCTVLVLLVLIGIGVQFQICLTCIRFRSYSRLRKSPQREPFVIFRQGWVQAHTYKPKPVTIIGQTNNNKSNEDVLFNHLSL